MTDDRDSFVNEGADEAPTISTILRVLRDYGRFILALVVATVLVTACLVMILYVRAPKEQLGTTAFRLTFEDDEFANGMRFSTGEIVSTAVLAEVYKANDLQQYGALADFKDAVFVLQSNPAMDLLALEYQTKLGDSKLTTVDRSRLEEEFRKKRDSLKALRRSWSTTGRPITAPRFSSGMARGTPPCGCA